MSWTVLPLHFRKRERPLSDRPYIHPLALVETSDVGAGTRVWAFAHVMSGAKVGENCNVGDHAFVEDGATVGDRVTIKNGCLIWHGVEIEDEVFIGPNVVFTNDATPRMRYKTGPEDWVHTHVASRASIGANSTILCGIRLGSNCMIGAGSVVTRDVPDHALVYGNPATQHGWVCECGAVLDGAFSCAGCGRRYGRKRGGGLSER